MDKIDWTACPDVESVPGRCGGQPVVKGTRVMVESCILGNFDSDQTPLQIARMFALPVATVRRVLHFGLTAQLAALAERRARWNQADAERYDRLSRQAGSIEAALRRHRQAIASLPLDLDVEAWGGQGKNPKASIRGGI